MVKLGDVCKIIGGYAFKSEEFITDGVPVIRISNLDGETVNVDKNVCYSVEFLKNNYNFIVRKNDILMAMSGATVGKIGVYPNEYVALLNQRVCNLKPVEDKLNREYLNCYCQSDYFKSEILKNAFGCAQPNISVKQIADFEIKILDLKSQVRIANKLKNILCLIEKRKQQLQKLDELVKARFVEMFGSNDAPVGGFRKDCLKNLCKKITDGKHGGCVPQKGTGKYFVGAREIYDDKVHYDTAPEISVDDFEKDYKRCDVEVGDFLIVNTGATIGKSAIAVDERTDCTLLQKSVALIKVIPEVLNTNYLKWCYSVNEGMYRVDSASAQPNLLLSKIKGTVIYVPPLELQNEFSAFVQQIDKSKLSVQKSLERLETLKKALMQKYFG